ncbi:MAG: RDD family protein [Campylobacteraceae bacterium]|jgi:uncharacterized RDD family membrane protein YckC|nr:RDD family protein [Campylobacteraceae bacterium]
MRQKAKKKEKPTPSPTQSAPISKRVNWADGDVCQSAFEPTQSAPISRRVKAFIIDMFMINMAILYFAVYIILGSREEFLQNQSAIFICTMVFGVILSIFFAAKGQSPGYKAYDIKLIDARTGEKPGFFRAYWRFLCFMFSGAIVVGLLLVFFRDDKKSLHDILSDTICIECI